MSQSTNLPTSYLPSDHESRIYKLWESAGVFKPTATKEGEEVFSLVAPPPNANADLHIGYALTIAVEDTIVRYNRLKGRATLFIPGADHAGFETQSVYEKQLAKDGKSRLDYSREDLYKNIWDFVEHNRGNFHNQLRSLGGSFDWDKFVFTLDEKVIKQTYATFKKMWDEGLIYRGERLVNYCTFHGTSFADIEVEYKNVNGHLWFIKYPLVEGGGELAIATTRPETMLGDTAVAVHPDDERYQKFIGKSLRLPLTNREIPVIADASVDPQFGTGAVKITPAHDQNDFDMAQRHDLPLISVIGHDGIMTHDVPEDYRGLTYQDARKQVAADLDKQGYLEKIETHKHSVGHCYRCGNVLQPLLSEQWFVNMQPLAAKATAALKDNQIKFYPASKKEQLLRYWEGLKDWNISRQIAWGIPIPAFQSSQDPSKWVFDDRVDQESIEIDGVTYHRDPDVFDTWFSSSSWPYVTLDYPDSPDFNRFYPLSLMETGGEILYPWVSRMIILGLYITGKAPFKEVYIHGYVMAEDGSKMSKSTGNVINLTDVVDKYGSDAMRMGLLAGRVAGVNRGYDSRRVEEARNLTNKLWNVARYAQDYMPDTSGHNQADKGIVDHWILERFNLAVTSIDNDLASYRLAEAYETLYHFIWNDLADWYLEASKHAGAVSADVFREVLGQTLAMAHPFAPFATEVLWQNLSSESSLLAGGNWPTAPEFDKAQASRFEGVKSLIEDIRSLSTSLGLAKPKLIYAPDPSNDLLVENLVLIQKLGRVGEVETADGPSEGMVALRTAGKIWLEATPEAINNYKVELKTRIESTKKSIAGLHHRLANTAYMQKAPKHLVDQTQTQAQQEQDRLTQLQADLDALKL